MSIFLVSFRRGLAKQMHFISFFSHNMAFHIQWPLHAYLYSFGDELRNSFVSLTPQKARFSRPTWRKFQTRADALHNWITRHAYLRANPIIPSIFQLKTTRRAAETKTRQPCAHQQPKSSTSIRKTTSFWNNNLTSLWKGSTTFYPVSTLPCFGESTVTSSIMLTSLLFESGPLLPNTVLGTIPFQTGGLGSSQRHNEKANCWSEDNDTGGTLLWGEPPP